jgi:hypothetical protein
MCAANFMRFASTRISAEKALLALCYNFVNYRSTLSSLTPNSPEIPFSGADPDG